MPWMLDGMAVLIIAICVLSAYRRGFLCTLVLLTTALVAFYLSLTYSQTIAEWLYAQFFSERISQLVAQRLSDFTAADAASFAEGLADLAAELPAVFSSAFLSQLRLYVEQWYQQLAGSSAPAMTTAITEAIIAPLATGLLRVITFCVLFGLLSTLGRAVAGLCKTVNYLPIIGTFNALLGGVLGAIQGMLYVFVASALLWLALSASGGQLGALSAETVDQTLFFRYFYAAGPWVNSSINASINLL